MSWRQWARELIELSELESDGSVDLKLRRKRRKLLAEHASLNPHAYIALVGYDDAVGLWKEFDPYYEFLLGLLEKHYPPGHPQRG